DEEVEIKKGDLVTFPKGLKCKWNVIERIRKAYIFNPKT
ncbi:MAG TPA: cupin, partial [Deltaproteobacteria bacterium]|nr:cupin [Deltaproteobacteria bacterium]